MSAAALLAKTPEGPTFFVVEKGTPGFEPGRSEEKHGIRASQTSALVFRDVFVPVENLIGGQPGKGLKQANQVFGYTRVMVASMALGAGEAALQIAAAYAKERFVSGSLLSDKQGYTHKLFIPNAARLEAAAAYIEQLSERLDTGEKDLQVEGSIVKYFSSEAANRTADDAIQAMGGYGYINEFEVEKIKRDVKITCIYEGASEVQQNIISTFRWRTTVKSKGAFYSGLADEMNRLEAEHPDMGCGFIALAAGALNEAVLLVHANKLTRQQIVMFGLADMMTYVEVGAALARKAAMASQNNDPAAEKLQLASAIFADEVSQLVTGNITRILMGSGAFDQQAIAEFTDRIDLHRLLESAQGVIGKMDRLADIVFERSS